MRRKSERTASRKSKASPEKKVEKTKKIRSRRRKHSTSSENESADETVPVVAAESVSIENKQPPESAATEASPEESQDQVWHVKTSEESGDVGELKKLKICLARPPSTPERVDRSPRSKRKLSRATSSSDTPSTEGTEERKKSKHRKRATRDLKEELDREDSHTDEPEGDTSNEVTQSETTKSTEPVETPMSTTTEEVKINDIQQSETVQETSESVEPPKDSSQDDKTSAADTTVSSPKDETRLASSPAQTIKEPQTQQVDQSDIPIQNETDLVDEDRAEEKSEILELHAEESKCESDNEASQSEVPKEDLTAPQEEKAAAEKVSINEENINKDTKEIDANRNKDNNKTNVVESSDNDVKEREATKPAVDSGSNTPDAVRNVPEQQETDKQDRDLKQNDSVISTNTVKQDVVANGQAAPIVRKRRWGTRSKLTTQKSITISTDILKDIIPDVKPVEFEEVIEEKKHKRERTVSEKVERPVLPKIVIDNTDTVENKRESEEKSREVPKPRDLAANRKISIVKENESIIARPPSPPRNKQSCILYITNLVRPFTLPQLKNLLQRTGRIVENGFWIDRIKSKCFVQYENEDQAVETRHALHGVTWPVSNPKTLQVDFSTEEAFDKAKSNEEADSAPVSTIPGTVEDWLREQDLKRERGDMEKPWERKTREWDLGKNEKDKDKEKGPGRRDERVLDKRRHRTPEKSPEPARKFKKKEEEAPAKLLDDLFRKTKTTPCIYWLPLSAETIAIKEEQRRQHMAEHERRLQELRRHRRH